MAKTIATALAYFDGKRGYLTTIDEGGLGTEISTTAAAPGRVVHVDDGKDLPIRFAG
jgi:hypothetical protein